MSSRKNKYDDKFDLRIKISKSGRLDLYDNKNLKIASFKTFSELQKEDF
jgi:hypothetical protein